MCICTFAEEFLTHLFVLNLGILILALPFCRCVSVPALRSCGPTQLQYISTSVLGFRTSTLATTMIVVDTSDAEAQSDAASIRTLVTIPKFPRYFSTLAYVSLPISTAAFICALMNGDHILGHLNSLLTIFAFVFTLPYQVLAILLVWLHSHQTESILTFSPASRKNLVYTTSIALMWISSATLTGWVMGNVVVDEGTTEGRKLVTPTLAFSLSIIETIIMGAITGLCLLHRRLEAKHSSDPQMLELQPSRDSNTKVISP